MPKKAAKKGDFKSSVDELTKLVDTMESGDLSLEETLSHFERGIKLTKDCQKILSDAEQKVKILLEKNGSDTLSDFNEDE